MGVQASLCAPVGRAGLCASVWRLIRLLAACAGRRGGRARISMLILAALALIDYSPERD